MENRLKGFAAAKLRGWLTVLSLLLTLAIGGLLRLYNLNWDQGALYHPDERWITTVSASLDWPESMDEFLDPTRSPLNPYFDYREQVPRRFAYGTLPVYSTRAVSAALAHAGMSRLVSERALLAGRALSGVLDTVAVLLVFLLGRRLFGLAVGLLGAVLYAFTALSIQHSHFYTTDIWVSFSVLLTIYFATDIVRHGTGWSGLLTGAAAGMALASKLSAGPVLLVIPLALLLHRRTRDRQPDPSTADLASCGIVAALGFLLFYLVFSPYSLLDTRGLLDSMSEQNRILVTGEIDVPYTRQYINTTPYLYPLDQMVRWAMGVPLGLTALGGWVLLIVKAVRERSAGAILLLGWMLPYFLITGRFHAKFLRYMLPLLPLLAIAAALLLVSVCAFVTKRRPAERPSRPTVRLARTAFGYAALAAVAAVPLSTVLWALAFVSIYTEPHPANRAAAWVNANVPKGSVISTEHWDEGLRGLKRELRGPSNAPRDLPLYNKDDSAKLDHLRQTLANSDYIVFYSNRLYGTVPRLPERYPMSRRYYELLFRGQLGYELVFFSSSYLRLAGVAVVEDTFSRPGLPVPPPLADHQVAPITINGGFADESWSVYDHPLVMVFRKSRPITEAEIDAALRPSMSGETPASSQH